jgi:hypothetical protein
MRVGLVFIPLKVSGILCGRVSIAEMLAEERIMMPTILAAAVPVSAARKSSTQGLENKEE